MFKKMFNQLVGIVVESAIETVIGLIGAIMTFYVVAKIGDFIEHHKSNEEAQG